MTLQEATEKVARMAEKHGGQFGSQANFRFSEGGLIHLDDSTAPARVSNTEAEAPCTVILSLENFDKMLNGDLNPMMAFMSGKMKIEGDKGVAMKLASLF